MKGLDEIVEENKEADEKSDGFYVITRLHKDDLKEIFSENKMIEILQSKV